MKTYRPLPVSLFPALLIFLLATGCSQQVQTGEIVTCPQCRKEVSNTVAVLKVPAWKAGEYSVKRSESFCQPCGDELVTYKISTTCKHCGKVEVAAEQAQRKTKPVDQSKTVKYCACGDELVPVNFPIACQRCGKVYRTETAEAKRSKEVKGKTITAGYCSNTCENLDKLRSAFKKGGQAAGAAAKGISEGIAEELNRK